MVFLFRFSQDRRIQDWFYLNWIFPFRFSRFRFRRSGLLQDRVLDAAKPPVGVTDSFTDNVPRILQLPDRSTNAVHSIPAYPGKSFGGVVPILRQGQHEGQQPLRFQRQCRVPQMMVCHHRVVAGFLNAKYRHNLTSLRRSGKVFVFGKNSILCPLASPCGKTYGHLICISYMKKYLRFLTPFNTVFRVLDGK